MPNGVGAGIDVNLQMVRRAWEGVLSYLRGNVPY
jgi:hypothetical protein